MQSVEYTDLRLEARGGALEVQLNRPAALNAWTPATGRELLRALRSASADPCIRAILLTGAGRAFCAGADLKVPRELTKAGEPDLHTRLEEIYNPVILELRRMPKPVVAAVHGAAAGLGFSLALGCDFVLASESAYFVLSFVHLGLMPDAGALPHLVARVGALRATELAMLGERLSATRAHEWGIVNEVHPDAELKDAALGLTSRLATAPTLALASIKEAVNTANPTELAVQMAAEARLQQRHAATGDYVEGVAAFKSRRAAQFVGH